MANKNKSRHKGKKKNNVEFKGNTKDDKVTLVTAILCIATLITLITGVIIMLNSIKDVKEVERDLALRYEKSTRTERIKHLIDEIDNIYNEYYIGELDYDEIERMILAGYVAGTSDKYGAYLIEEKYREYSGRLNDRIYGVGFEIVYEEDSVYVSDVYVGSPAYNSGIRAGDIILGIGGKRIDSIDYNEYLTLIDSNDAEMRLELEDRELILSKEVINTSNVSLEMIDDIALIRVKRFSYNSDVEVIGILDELEKEGIKKVIFDLRENNGGVVEATINIIDRIVPKGLIARVERKNGDTTEFYSSSKSFNGEIVILVNERSASASELFSLALRDYDMATIIGEKTFGKGTSSINIPVSFGSINVSNGKIYTKESENIEGKGIEPDIRVRYEAEEDLYRVKIEDDNQLQFAIDFLGD